MRTALLGAATVAALAAGTLATTSVLGSSHREAPRIMLDPSADNTDLYAFTAPDAPGKLTVISNWVPLQNPAGGPYFGKLDPEAHYYVKIDNTGDGVEDVAYRWEFKNEFRNPDSFLYAVPPVNIDQRHEPQLRPDLRPLPRALQQRARSSTSTGSRRACRSRRTTSGRRRCPTTRGCPARPSAGCPAAARRSSARPTTRSSSTSARSSTASTSTSRAARRSGSATRAAATTTSPATTSTRSRCRSRSPRSRATARPCPARRASNAVVGVWTTTERKADQGQARQGARSTGCRSAASATR